jgi:hypothetical protein
MGERRGPPHLPHRRGRLAPPGRGVRRRLRAAARPRLRRDVRGHRVGHAELAASAGHRRGQVRGPDRAHAAEQRPRVTPGGRVCLLLHEHAPPAAGRPGARRGADQPARGIRAACSLVRGVLLPYECRAHASERRPVLRHRQRQRHPVAPVRRLPGIGAGWRAAAYPAGVQRVPFRGHGRGQGHRSPRAEGDAAAAAAGLGPGLGRAERGASYAGSRPRRDPARLPARRFGGRRVPGRGPGHLRRPAHRRRPGDVRR